LHCRRYGCGNAIAEIGATRSGFEASGHMGKFLKQFIEWPGNAIATVMAISNGSTYKMWIIQNYANGFHQTVRAGIKALPAVIVCDKGTFCFLPRISGKIAVSIDSPWRDEQR